MNFIIKGTVYPFDVMVSIGEEDNLVRNKLLKNGVLESDLPDTELIKIRGMGRTLMFTKGQTLIRILNTPKTNQEYAILQHEIFHAVEFIMTRIGMTLCDESCEAFAYLIQYYTYEIYNKL